MSAKSRRSSTGPSPVAGTAAFETIGDWLRYAVTTFSRAPLAFAQGLHGPQEEATFLVSRFLGIAQVDLLHFLSARLTKAEITGLRELVRKRVVERIPVPYLVHEAVLGDLAFHVDERVLIPRSYIVELIPDQINVFARDGWAPGRILELGTGSACLAILAALAYPGAVVDAVDISEDALEVAATNVHAHNLDNRIQLLRSDLFNAVPRIPYDLIIANPPYEPSALVDEQPRELAHEPRLALDGGEDGMECVRRIIQEAQGYLSPAGILVLELGGLRTRLVSEFPKLKCHVFNLHDASDAVLGIHARDLDGI